MEIFAAVALIAVAAALGFLSKYRRSSVVKTPKQQIPKLDELIGASDKHRFVLFSTEFCARCPAVFQQLSDLDNDLVEISQIDLTENIELARELKINQTPTTFLIAATGELVTRFGPNASKQDFLDSLAKVEEYASNPN